MDIVVYLSFLAAPLLAGGVCFLVWKTFIRGQKPSRVARFIVMISAMFFGISLFAFSAETYYRFFYDQTDSVALNRATRRWFARHYERNAAGLRDNIQTYRKLPATGKRRLTFLGDSFVVGHGIKDVENRFLNIIRANQNSWEVHLLAKNGLNTSDQIKMLEQAISKGYQLDLVVLVYVLNDLEDLHPKSSEIVKEIFQDFEDESVWIKYSYFLNTWWYRYRSRQNPALARWDAFIAASYAGVPWNLQKIRLQQLHETVQRNGGSLRVITFPFLHLLGPDYPLHEAHQKIAHAWEKLGVPHLDLSVLFKDYPPKKLIVNTYDYHPNEFAHRLAAEAIESFLDVNKG